MEGESHSEVITRPLGEVGIELGLSRAELLDIAHDQWQASFDYFSSQLEITFALLIAMFFIAHRLSRAQFVFLLVAYSVFFIASFVSYITSLSNQEYFLRAAGIITANPELPFGITIPVAAMPFVLCAILYFGCIWWSISCRRNQPKELGSPL